MKIVICEDQENHRMKLKSNVEKILLEKEISYEIVVFESGEKLFANYPESADIFILDIQMDKINGMDVAREIRKRDKNIPEIIFTTSVVEYIQEGYEVRAYRYLLKPIKLDELRKHLLSCINEIKERKDKYLIINGKSEIYKIDINTITHVEIQQKDMIIHTTDNNYELRMSMDKIEKELKEYNFFRCHKSFLINIKQIQNIKQYFAILENGQEVTISRHRFKDLKMTFLDHLGSVI